MPTICLAGLVLFAAAPALDVGDRLALAAEQETTIEVSLRQGLLSVDLRETSLATALSAIGDEAGFRVAITGDLDTPVSWSFTDVPLDKALRRLLQNTNWVLIHGPARDGGTGRLVAVHAWPGHGAAAESAARVAKTIRTGNGELAGRPPLVSPDDDRSDRLRAVRKLASQPHAGAAKVLALVLSEDEDAVVRRVAAIGLGKLAGGPVLAALAAALDDEDKWVRRRAIQGLRRIGGEEAARAVGETLAGDPDPEVRRAAARTLGRMRSEEALGALDAARFDPDFSVRQAVLAGLARLEDM